MGFLREKHDYPSSEESENHEEMNHFWLKLFDHPALNASSCRYQRYTSSKRTTK
jgi:hypothetical protein